MKKIALLLLFCGMLPLFAAVIETETIQIPLKKGWNAITVAMKLEAVSADVLSKLHIYCVKGNRYVQAKSSDFKPGVGLFLYSDSDTTLELDVQKTSAAEVVTPSGTGWRFAGFSDIIFTGANGDKDAWTNNVKKAYIWQGGTFLVVDKVNQNNKGYFVDLK